MLQLCPRLANVAAQLQTEGADAQANIADDEDAARGMARLCIEAGETYTHMLTSGAKQASFIQVARIVSCVTTVRGPSSEHSLDYALLT